jgi:uncharacterized membrane protein
MSYTTLTHLHLATVVPAFFIGTYILLNQKGTPAHRTLGKLFMIPVAIFGPRAYFAARRGDISKHKASIIGVYIGALLFAGAVAIFTPGRLLHVWLFE